MFWESGILCADSSKAITECGQFENRDDHDMADQDAEQRQPHTLLVGLLCWLRSQTTSSVECQSRKRCKTMSSEAHIWVPVRDLYPHAASDSLPCFIGLPTVPIHCPSLLGFIIHRR